jgi:hypothetical protein
VRGIEIPERSDESSRAKIPLTPSLSPARLTITHKWRRV